MIQISYNDFMPNSGNLNLESIQNKIQELFLADNEVFLIDTGEQFDSSQKNELAEDIMRHWAEHNVDSSLNTASEGGIGLFGKIMLTLTFVFVGACFFAFFHRLFPSTSERSIPGIYVYQDVIDTKYTLILYRDKTVSITEHWAGDSELAKDLSARKSKGSWRKLTYEGEPYITIDMTNGTSLYMCDDYIYTDYRAMKAKDYNNGFPISKY